jgi:hypothetical protein
MVISVTVFRDLGTPENKFDQNCKIARSGPTNGLKNSYGNRRRADAVGSVPTKDQA